MFGSAVHTPVRVQALNYRILAMQVQEKKSAVGKSLAEDKPQAMHMWPIRSNTKKGQIRKTHRPGAHGNHPSPALQDIAYYAVAEHKAQATVQGTISQDRTPLEEGGLGAHRATILAAQPRGPPQKHAHHTH